MLGTLLKVDLIIFFLTNTVVYLLGRLRFKNNYHLKYLILHIVAHILLLLWFRFNVTDYFNADYANLITIARAFSIVMLYYHIKNLTAGKDMGLNKLDKIAFIIFVSIVALLNLGIRVFDEAYVGDYLSIYVDEKSPTKEVTLVWLIYFLFMSFRFFKNYPKIILNSNKFKRPKIYLLWIIVLHKFITINAIISIFVAFKIFHPILTYSNLQELSGLSILIFMVLNPVILFHFPILNRVEVLKPEIMSSIKDLLDTIIMEDKIYLKPMLTINEFSILCQASPTEVRKYILKTSGLNFTDFINSYRVSYSVMLIKEKYLESHSVYALGEESGFNSHQTFYRAFKKIHNTTPANYNKLNTPPS